MGCEGCVIFILKDLKQAWHQGGLINYNDDDEIDDSDDDDDEDEDKDDDDDCDGNYVFFFKKKNLCRTLVFEAPL